jgi:hypothetical protein
MLTATVSGLVTVRVCCVDSSPKPACWTQRVVSRSWQAVVTDGEPRYATAAAFRRGIADRLKQEAEARGRPVRELRREFVFQRFLARLFADPTSPWILKGATGLLVRLPGARYSRDIDLLYPSQSLDLRGAVEELRGMARTDLGDHLSFVIDDPVVQADGQTLATLGVTGYTGATRFDRFSVDLSTELHVIGSFERLRPEPVIQGCTPATASHRAQHAFATSLTWSSSLQRAHSTPTSPDEALQSEARRRNMTLPERLRAPGSQWVVGYAETARHSSLPAELRRLDAALARGRGMLGSAADRFAYRWALGPATAPLEHHSLTRASACRVGKPQGSISPGFVSATRPGAGTDSRFFGGNYAARRGTRRHSDPPGVTRAGHGCSRPPRAAPDDRADQGHPAGQEHAGNPTRLGHRYGRTMRCRRPRLTLWP